jgi:DNA-binding transcriptional regulator YdaS (Cro superfamily)
MNLKLKIAILEKFPIQADFAKRIGISETVLSRIIKERRDAPPELRKMIADALKVKENEIFGQ